MTRDRGGIACFATVLFTMAFFASASFFTSDVAVAAYKNADAPCTVDVKSTKTDNVPVMYEGHKRSNPDGSAYPGDALHFLFEYSASDTCTSLRTSPLIMPDNAVFSSALAVSDSRSEPYPHAVDLYQWVPKYLDTHHYYEIIHTDVKSRQCKGGCSNPYIITHTLAEYPVASIREDQQPSTSQARQIFQYGTGYIRDDIQKITTSNWHLVYEKSSVGMGAEEHSLEDDASVDAFVAFVQSRCTDLQKYQGCIFGHAEIDTDGTAEQICLFEELDRLGIEYDESEETDECVLLESQNDMEITVTGKGIRCDDGKCKTFTVTDSATAALDILHPFGDVLFEYPQINDPDGFPSKNNDLTYYLERAIGIHASPDAAYKDVRGPLISFDSVITGNPLDVKDSVTCGIICDVILAGPMISPFNGTIGNGDLLSYHFTDDRLGISEVLHVSKMYNIGRLIGQYDGTASVLSVVYDPQISEIRSWSRLADAGFQSFDNRYAIAVKYDGSRGGGPDDGDADAIHPERPVKITDILGSYLITNSFGQPFLKWNPDSSMSASDGLDDLAVLDSVYEYIPSNYTFVDSWNDPANVLWNATVADTMMESAGHARILKDVYISDDLLETYQINVTSNDVLASFDYAGQNKYLGISNYEFPWGYFSTPFNVTSYFVGDGRHAVIDKDVDIVHIDIEDAALYNGENFVSTVRFYLNGYDGSSHEFAYMHMADMYDMNPKKSFTVAGNGTALLILNKTGITYDLRAYNAFAKGGHLGDGFGGISDLDVLNMTDREFFTGASRYDVEISARRDGGDTVTNTVLVDGPSLSEAIHYKLNMHPQNRLYVDRWDDTATIPHDSDFGAISEILVNGVTLDGQKAACSDGCIVFLPSDVDDDEDVDVAVRNIWGGVATAQNLTDMKPDTTDADSWIDTAPLRYLWIGIGLAFAFFAYWLVKWWFKNVHEK